MTSIIIFAIAQTINVITSTIKSILTINGGKHTAGLANAISWTVSAIIIKLISKHGLEIVIPITFVTNYIGVYIGKTIMDKFKPVKLWTIQATLKDIDIEKIEKSLISRSIKFVIVPAMNDRTVLNIFAYTKAESALVVELLETNEIPYVVFSSQFASEIE